MFIRNVTKVKVITVHNIRGSCNKQNFHMHCLHSRQSSQIFNTKTFAMKETEVLVVVLQAKTLSDKCSCLQTAKKSQN